MADQKPGRQFRTPRPTDLSPVLTNMPSARDVARAAWAIHEQSSAFGPESEFPSRAHILGSPSPLFPVRIGDGGDDDG